MTLDDFISLVKPFAEHYEKSVREYVPGQKQVSAETHARQQEWAAGFRKLVDYLTHQKRLSTPIPKSLGDISDLPDELVKELAVTPTDELEDQVLTVVRACNGEANLDQVLVGLYRKFKVIQTRRYLQNKMYRMSKKLLLYPIPGQRAAYSLQPKDEPNSAFLLQGAVADEDDDGPPF